MDTLGVIRKAQRLGGDERRAALVELIVAARKLGCKAEIGGGQAGGINLRFGTIGYALMDINTLGNIKLYVSPHPNSRAPEELVDQLNGYIEKSEDLVPKSFPIKSHGVLESLLEEIDTASLHGYLELAVSCIRDTYYKPHFEHLGT